MYDILSGNGLAREKGFEVPFQVPDEAVMMLELRSGAAGDAGGTVVYPPAFDIFDEHRA